MIFRNVLSNWATLVITAAVSLAITPLMINGLGNFYFGLWILVGSLVDYYGLLDIGIRATLQRFVARLKARDDRSALDEAFASGLALTCGVAAVILTATVVLAALPRHFGFGLAPEVRILFGHLLLCMGSSVAITLVARLLGAYLCGLQRFDLYNLAATVTTLCRAGAIVLVLRYQGGVLGVALVSVGSGVLLLALNWFLLRRADRDLRVRWNAVSVARVKELLTFSVYVFLNTAGDYLRSYTDALVIARFLGVALITPFSVAAKLIEHFKALIIAVTGPLMPLMSGLDGQKRDAELRDVLLRATRLTAFLASLLAWLLMINGDELIILWLGAGFEISATLMKILLLGAIVALAQAPSTVMLTAKGVHRPLAYWTVTEGILNLVLSIYWAGQYGLIGVALGTTVPMLFFKIFIQPWYVLRVMKIGAREYLSAAFVSPIIVNVVFAVICYATGAFGSNPSFVGVMVAVTWQVIVFVTLAYVGLDTATRQFVKRHVEPGVPPRVRWFLARLGVGLRTVRIPKLAEVMIRRVFKRSDYRRWSDHRELQVAWDSRVEQIAALIPPGSRVIEFGAGRRQLEALLHPSCTYTPSDLVDRGPGTLVWDLNKRPLPDLGVHDVAVFSGVLEYLFDVPAVMRWIESRVPMCIVSYACVRESPWMSRTFDKLSRTNFSWVNSFSEPELLAIFAKANYQCVHRADWLNQAIWVLLSSRGHAFGTRAGRAGASRTPDDMRAAMGAQS